MRGESSGATEGGREEGGDWKLTYCSPFICMKLFTTFSCCSLFFPIPVPHRSIFLAFWFSFFSVSALLFFFTDTDGGYRGRLWGQLPQIDAYCKYSVDSEVLAVTRGRGLQIWLTRNGACMHHPRQISGCMEMCGRYIYSRYHAPLCIFTLNFALLDSQQLLHFLQSKNKQKKSIQWEVNWGGCKT